MDSTTITTIVLGLAAAIVIGCPMLIFAIIAHAVRKYPVNPKPAPAPAPAPPVKVQQPVALMRRWTPDRIRWAAEERQDWAYKFAQAQIKR